MGPLEVVSAGVAMPLSSRNERVVLAALALCAGSTVSTDRLIDAVWGETPPRSAAKALQNIVLRVRKSLGSDVIQTQPSGYALGPSAAAALDVRRFEQLVHQGRSAAAVEDWAAACDVYQVARALWRGPPFPDLEHWAPARGEVARLEEAQRCTFEDHAEAELNSGRHRALVPTLELMASDEPLRERRWSLLMLALYRDGRQVDALRAFQRARDELAALGLEPSPSLCELEQAILGRDPRLDWTPASPPAHVTTTGEPATLPVALTVPSTFDFVGRSSDWEALSGAYREACAGWRRVVIVGGEAGVGKTRLVFEFARNCAEQGAAVHLGACDEALAIPYQPWAQIVDQMSSATTIESVDPESLGALSVLLPRLGNGHVAVAPSADPEWQRLRMFEAVEAVILAASAVRPLVLILEDLHWASGPTLELLRHIGKRGTGRVLILGTFRDTGDEIGESLTRFLAEQSRIDTTRRLHLDGLDRRAVNDLVTGFVGHQLDERLTALSTAIADETAGNAFFVGAIWNHLVASGVVATDNGRWYVSRRDGDAIEVPPTVRDVVALRIARLAETTREVAALIATAGATIETKVLRRAFDGSVDELGEALDELLEAKLIVFLGTPPTAVQFAHALVREAIEQAIPSSRVARLHRRLGEAIEIVYEHDRRPVLANLARHFVGASTLGDTERAIYYSRRAVRQALQSYDFDVAITHLDVAIALVTPGTETHVELLLDRAEAGTRSGLDPGAMEAYLSAYQLAREAGLITQAARAIIGLEAAHQIRGLPTILSADVIESTLQLVDASDGGLRIELGAALVRSLKLAGRAGEADARGEDLLRSARDTGDARLIIAAIQAITADGLIEPRRLQDLSRELCDLADQQGDLWNLCWGLSNMIRSNLMLGDVDEARSDLERDRHAAELGRFDVFQYQVLVGEAVLAIVDGRFDDALTWANAASEFFEEQREFNDGVYGLQMFTIYREQGRLGDMAPVLRAASAATPVGSVWRPGLAILYAELGMLAEARAEFDELASDGFCSVPRDALWPACLAYLAEVCVAIDDRRAAATLYRELRPMSGTNIMVGFTVCLGPADRPLGLLAALLGRPDAARSHFEQALSTAAACRSGPWTARIQHDWATSLGEHDRLELARAAADQFGMRAVVADCDRVLGDARA